MIMKPEKIFRTFRTIVRNVGDEEGVLDMLIPMSTAKTDRHGESIDPKGWKKHLKEFKKRAILLSSHNYRGLLNQIGELLDLQVVEEGLLARPKYYINQGNPEADWAYFLATKGKAAFSVGFIPIKWIDAKEEPTRTYKEQELVEISQVTVPSNTDAAQGLMAKAEYKDVDPVVKEIINEIIEDKDFFKEGEVKAIIEDKLKDVKADPIDPEKVKASIEKDDKEIVKVKYKYMDAEGNEIEKEENILSVEGKIGYSLNDIYDIVKENKELKEKLKDIELKAGAVLNAKNKSNLKQAIALVQSVLDSAGTEEGLNDKKGDETKDTKTDDKKADPVKNEETEEERSKEINEIIEKSIAKKLNYLVGKVEE